MNIETAMQYLVNVHHIEDSKENRKLVLKNWQECKNSAENEPDASYYCGTYPIKNGKKYQGFINGMLITYFQDNEQQEADEAHSCYDHLQRVVGEDGTLACTVCGNFFDK